MDTLIHILLGLATATVIGSQVACRPAQKWKILLLGIIGGVFPDIDAISLWTGFDSSIGQWFPLSHTGREIYHGHLWYSHRGFMHSLLGLLLWSTILTYLLSAFYTYILKGARHIRGAISYLWPYFAAFAAAYGMHLVADLFTPAGTWGGIRLFFPFEVYVGGWGMVWWWNNYDIFTLLLVCVAVNSAAHLFMRSGSRNLRLSTLAVWIGCMGFMGFQIHARGIDFNTDDFVARDYKALTFQAHHLPKPWFETLWKMDEAIPWYF